MTIQYVQIQTYDFGATLSPVTLRHPTTDAVIATADTCEEIGTDAGVYLATFDGTSVIAAGQYRLRAVVSGSPINRWVTLAGVDGEVAFATMERAVSGGLTEAQEETLDSIATAIAGSSPVEPTGTTVFGLLEQIADSTGTGARTVTITVNDGSAVLQNARVRLTEGANTFTGLTNASGVVTFNLDDATYTVSITKSGYSYAGATLVVDGTEAVTYSMTQITPSAPDDPALCAVTIPIVNQFGAALPGEVVEIRFNEFVTGADTTVLVLSPPPTLTSDDEGLVEVNLLRDGKYSVFYGQDGYKRRLDFTVPDAGSFTVGE